MARPHLHRRSFTLLRVSSLSSSSSRAKRKESRKVALSASGFLSRERRHRLSLLFLLSGSTGHSTSCSTASRPGYIRCHHPACHEVQSSECSRGEKSRGRARGTGKRDYSDDLMLVYAIKVNRSLCRKIMGCRGSRGFEEPRRTEKKRGMMKRGIKGVRKFKSLQTQCGAHS